MALKKIEQNNKIHLGINNKLIQLPFVHPWIVFFGLYSLILLLALIDSDIDKLKRSILISLPICLALILFVIIYHRNSCYKLVVSNTSKQITFHMMFTKKTVVADMDKISVEIGRVIKLYLECSGYRILSETLHDIVSYLPADTEIKFKGFFGKQFKEELKKINKPLTPGKYF